MTDAASWMTASATAATSSGPPTAEATILGWIWRDGVQLAWSPLLFHRGTGAPATGFGFGGNGTSLAYQLANIAGSTGILVSLVGGFNVSVALLQCTWIVISLYGIWRAWRARRVTRGAATR